MVLESNSVTYRYPTPVSPESKSLGSNVSSPVAKDPEPKSHTQDRFSPRTVNDAAVALSANSDAEVADVPSHNISLVPVVVIPGLASPSQRVYYETFPDIDARIGRGDDSPSKRRNRKDLHVEEEVLTLSVDQREKADAALRYCQDLIADIFEAEDHLQPDTSGAVTADAADFFISGAVGERELPLLTPGIQHKLERAIQKAISASRFDTIPVEHLGRVQKLCEGAVTAADGTSLGVEGGWTEDDLERWVNRIASVENGLQASRILLRIMTAGREEKQLYSEDLLQTVMNTVKHVVDSCLVPIAEARNIGQDTESFGIYAAHKKPLSSLVHLSSKVLRLLGELLVKVDVAEGAITAVEFLCARLIFVENGHSEKESALGVQKFELLRRTAMDVLAKIFARHSDQRTFIFDEILTSLEKLPVTRQSARQFKLVDGKPIQLVSALLMRLIQTSAMRSTHRSTTTGGTLVSANDRHEQDGASDFGEGDADVDQDREAEIDTTSESAHDDKMQRLIRLAKPLHDGAQANAHYLVKFMVQRALSSTKTGDQPYRNLLDIFTEDFIGVLGSTDWPAAEMLLRALLSNVTIEDIWISPFHSILSAKVESVQSRLAVKSQTSLIIKTVQRGEGVLSVLHSLLQGILSNDSKNAVLNFQVCKAMVAVMFDSIIDSDELSGRPTQAHVLQTLTVFAKASPKLFDTEQLELLQPYVANLSNTDDLLIYRSVIVIFRHVLPHMSSLQHGFLRAIQDALFSSIAKVGKMELNEISSCLWTIDSILNNTDRLVRLTTSVLKGIHVAKDLSPADDTPESAARSAGVVNRVKRLILIAGYFGKYCDFDQNAKSFKEEFPWWTGDSVASLVVDIICPLTNPKQPASIRETALESISMICQFWPRQYLRSDTNSAFETVFDSGDARLEHIVLSGIQDFFALEEKRSETGAEIPLGSGIVNGSDRLGKTYMATDHDGASTSIAQRFLRHILRIALSSVGELSLTATQVIASINRQGLVHPKECGPALVALETSPNAKVASIATQEHRTLHQKHESMFEKEYMRAVQRAFMFQKEVVRDTQGFTTQPFASKLRLLFDVLKTGNGRVRKKFLGNMCMRLDFELPKLNSAAGGIPATLEYARFCVENLAFFEYSRIDELLYLIACMEKVVANTGSVVANAIETEVLKDHLQPGHDGVASMILMMMWETRSFLQRLWGLRKYKETKTKPAIKEVNKSPVKAAFVTGDKFVEKITGIMSVLCTHVTQLDHCRTFLELLNVDNDLKVASETEENDIAKASARYETPSEERNLNSPSMPPSGGGRAMKRKGSGSIASTPRKKRAKPQTSKKKTGSASRSKDSGDEWD
ncbi:Sister chromatid cohesion protein 2 [Cryomyces antarcticus]|uniref:Sister chromatid cohesion protein n=1 Tax=Cryomyces antarcticus TaxID=329879 RepID=A0ABR0MA49_9PEZI|nr:Sister chromatid cohesion protein 2 [Cryomyces antarcticus]